MNFPADPALAAIMRTLGVEPDAFLGQGGEARVYALDDERVLRVLHSGGRTHDVVRRQRLVDELARARPRYALPAVLEVNELDGRVYAIERRLRGISVLAELRTARGSRRHRLIEAHLDTAAALGDLALDPRPAYGDLIADAPVTAPTWHEFLERRVAENLRRSTPALQRVDAAALAEPFPEPPTAAFVHLDAFAGNMLTDGTGITAVLDIGVPSVAGDRRFDPVASAVYLMSVAITPTATPADSDVATAWLRKEGLIDWLEPVRRWLAGYWSFALDDAAVVAWSSAVLLGGDRGA